MALTFHSNAPKRHEEMVLHVLFILLRPLVLRHRGPSRCPAPALTFLVSSCTYIPAQTIPTFLNLFIGAVHAETSLASIAVH